MVAGITAGKVCENLKVMSCSCRLGKLWDQAIDQFHCKKANGFRRSRLSCALSLSFFSRAKQGTFQHLPAGQVFVRHFFIHLASLFKQLALCTNVCIYKQETWQCLWQCVKQVFLISINSTPIPWV